MKKNLFVGHGLFVKKTGSQQQGGSPMARHASFLVNWWHSLVAVNSPTLATDRLKQLGTLCEKKAAVFFDAIMDTALQCVDFSKKKLATIKTRSQKVGH